jgi:hypothetical protein
LTDTSGTFGGWSDRVTYIVAEAQLLIAGVLVTLGIVLLWWQPDVPGVPAWIGGVLATFLLFGPPLFGFFVALIRRFRQRNMVEVHHVNSVQDACEKYMVAPEIWKEKNIEGPNPYPINGGSAWAVREFDFQEDVDQLVVRGVWLSEVEDVKMWTSKRHMNSVYEKLVESHMTLKIFRDSVSELGADIQGRLVNQMAEARERGTMLDKSAVKDVFEDFESSIEDMGTDDLPQLDHGDLPGESVEDLTDHSVEEMDAEISMGMGNETAADGGSEQ